MHSGFIEGKIHYNCEAVCGIMEAVQDFDGNVLMKREITGFFLYFSRWILRVSSFIFSINYLETIRDVTITLFKN